MTGPAIPGAGPAAARALLSLGSIRDKAGTMCHIRVAWVRRGPDANQGAIGFKRTAYVCPFLSAIPTIWPPLFASAGRMLFHSSWP